MICTRKMIPSTDGHEVPLDVYAPDVYAQIAPERRHPAVLVCPGGGYAFCSEREAEAVALRFVAHGFQAFVVWYRVAPNCFPAPQQDAAAALAHIRKNAAEYLVDENRIAILGFSAGGHLAASIGTLWERAELWQPMGLTPEDVKPNGMVLCYPVISGGKDAHRGSFENLSGSLNVEDHLPYSIDGWVTENSAPAFLWHTAADELVPVQNSLIMANALAEHNVPFEMHIYPVGIHGSSLCTDLTTNPGVNGHLIPEASVWPEQAVRFLNTSMR